MLISNRFHSRFIYLNEILYNCEIFGKTIGMLDFTVIDLNLAHNRYCL